MRKLGRVSLLTLCILALFMCLFVMNRQEITEQATQIEENTETQNHIVKNTSTKNNTIKKQIEFNTKSIERKTIAATNSRRESEKELLSKIFVQLTEEEKQILAKHPSADLSMLIAETQEALMESDETNRDELMKRQDLLLNLAAKLTPPGPAVPKEKMELLKKARLEYEKTAGELLLTNTGKRTEEEDLALAEIKDEVFRKYGL